MNCQLEGCNVTLSNQRASYCSIAHRVAAHRYKRNSNGCNVTGTVTECNVTEYGDLHLALGVTLQQSHKPTTADFAKLIPPQSQWIDPDDMTGEQQYSLYVQTIGGPDQAKDIRAGC